MDIITAVHGHGAIPVSEGLVAVIVGHFPEGGSITPCFMPICSREQSCSTEGSVLNVDFARIDNCACADLNGLNLLLSVFEIARG